MKDKEKALRINQQRCVVAIVFCSLMVALVFTRVVRNIFMEPDAFVKEVGAKTFRMFTVQSNMLVASMAMLCIPFEIDGLRSHDHAVVLHVRCDDAFGVRSFQSPACCA